MPTTKKTTKAVRDRIRGSRDIRFPKPRYTVELTTEGWQIKDNETGHVLDTFGAKVYADAEADQLNRAT